MSIVYTACAYCVSWPVLVQLSTQTVPSLLIDSNGGFSCLKLAAQGAWLRVRLLVTLQLACCCVIVLTEYDCVQLFFDEKCGEVGVHVHVAHPSEKNR